jgi:hypothetical protein
MKYSSRGKKYEELVEEGKLSRYGFGGANFGAPIMS